MRDVMAALDSGVGLGRPLVARRPSTWWDVHHAATAGVYVLMLWPGWVVVEALPHWRALAHIGLVCLATLATALRLHLWFGQRQYPAHVAATRQRWWPVLMGVDTVYAAVIGVLAIYAAETHLAAAVIAAGLAVGLAVASLVIEPATRRAEGGS